MLSSLLALLISLELCEIAVVITLHLQIENLGLALCGGWDKVFVEQCQNVAADFGELRLNLLGKEKSQFTSSGASNS